MVCPSRSSVSIRAVPKNPVEPETKMRMDRTSEA
jgi:hypothetical protein